MKLFALGLCSITLGAVGTIVLPVYFWSFVICIVLGFLCQLAAFWKTHKEGQEILSRMTEHQKWQADIYKRYTDASLEEAVKIVDEVIEKLRPDKEDQ